MIYLQLFWEYFKTGLFAIGGGLATLPFLYELADKYAWFTEEELANMIAVSESTPGPIGVNMATYAGINAAGIPGGVVATFSLVLPSLIVIIIVARMLERFRTNRYVNTSMSLLRPTSVAMVTVALLSVLKVALLNEQALAAGNWAGILCWPAIVLFAALLAIHLKWKKLHPIVLVALGAVAGIVLKL